mgnify:CR=1 FL=1
MGFFPPDHKFATDTASTFTQEETDRFYSPGKQLKDGDSHEVIVCGGFDTGHVISGYKYFNHIPLLSLKVIQKIIRKTLV